LGNPFLNTLNPKTIKKAISSKTGKNTKVKNSYLYSVVLKCRQEGRSCTR
jgi:hypothetical protein